jgi:hypothetical protein
VIATTFDYGCPTRVRGAACVGLGRVLVLHCSGGHFTAVYDAMTGEMVAAPTDSSRRPSKAETPLLFGVAARLSYEDDLSLFSTPRRATVRVSPAETLVAVRARRLFVDSCEFLNWAATDRLVLSLATSWRAGYDGRLFRTRVNPVAGWLGGRLAVSGSADVYTTQDEVVYHLQTGDYPDLTRLIRMPRRVAGRSVQLPVVFGTAIVLDESTTRREAAIVSFHAGEMRLRRLCLDTMTEKSVMTIGASDNGFAVGGYSPDDATISVLTASDTGRATVTAVDLE